MEEALKQGEDSLKDYESSNKDGRNGKTKSISEAELPEFEESRFSGNDSMEKLNFLKDLQLSIYIELDKLASEPVDIFVNNKKIAEGEVVVIDKHFGIRIVNLIDVNSRLKGL